MAEDRCAEEILDDDAGAGEDQGEGDQGDFVDLWYGYCPDGNCKFSTTKNMGKFLTCEECQAHVVNHLCNPDVHAYEENDAVELVEAKLDQCCRLWPADEQRDNWEKEWAKRRRTEKSGKGGKGKGKGFKGGKGGKGGKGFAGGQPSQPAHPPAHGFMQQPIGAAQVASQVNAVRDLAAIVPRQGAREGTSAHAFAEMIKKLAELAKNAEASCKVCARNARQQAEFFDAQSHEMARSWEGLDALLVKK